MVAKITASASTRRHCCRVKLANFGRTVVSRTAPATHWRIATTPTGPSTGKARAAVAAPSWLAAALPVFRATPVSRAGSVVVAGPGVAAPGRRSRITMVIAGAWLVLMHTQNAWTEGSIRLGYGSGAETPALPGRDRGRGHLHRCRHRARHLAGRGVTEPHRPRAGPGCPAAAPHQQEHHPDHGRSAHSGPGQAGTRRGGQHDRRGGDRPHE